MDHEAVTKFDLGRPAEALRSDLVNLLVTHEDLDHGGWVLRHEHNKHFERNLKLMESARLGYRLAPK